MTFFISKNQLFNIKIFQADGADKLSVLLAFSVFPVFLMKIEEFFLSSNSSIVKNRL